MRLTPPFLFLAIGLMSVAAPVCAGPSIWWHGWTLQSSENLSDAYEDIPLPQPLTHSLTALCDANPRTVWIMNPHAKLATIDGEDEEQFFSQTKRGLLISGASRLISGLQMMNGDNSSPRAFKSGNRIRTLKVTLLDGKKRHSYTRPLQDRMGWQQVSWPRQRADGVAIEFAELVKPKQPVCSSGLGLVDGTNEIKWNMPQVVMFYDGTEGDSSPPWLMTRQGKFLDGIENDYGYSDEWSSDGQFVAGCSGAGNGYIWVADTKQGRIIKKLALPSEEDEADYKWTGPHQLRVIFTRPDKKNNMKPFQTKIYHF